MENEEKIERLEKEIAELKEKKEKKEKINGLFDERNRLKFPYLYSTGRLLKKMGQGIAEWAEKKNKELEEQEKQKVKDNAKKGKKSSQNGSDKLYDALFGESELTKDLGFIE